MATVLAIQYEAALSKIEVICDAFEEKKIGEETHHVPIAGKTVRTVFVRDELAVISPEAAKLFSQFLAVIDPITRKKADDDVSDPHAVKSQALDNARERAKLIAEREHAEVQMQVARRIATEHTQAAVDAIAIKEAAEVHTASLALEAAKHAAEIAKLKAEKKVLDPPPVGLAEPVVLASNQQHPAALALGEKSETK